jgi:hypothetical protein
VLFVCACAFQGGLCLAKVVVVVMLCVVVDFIRTCG